MKKAVIALLFVLAFSAFYLSTGVFAEPGLNAIGGVRYVLLMSQTGVTEDKQVPAIILDSWQGVVWACQDVRSANPAWIKTDLGKNGDASFQENKYVIKMVEPEDADSNIPASVLDTQEGVIWTCPNIIDKEAAWIQKDLRSNVEKEIPKKGKSRINIKFDNKDKPLF